MSEQKAERVGRRTFLNRMALAAGAVPLSSELLVPAKAAETASPQQPKAASGYTTRLAAYAAGLKYEDIPQAVRQRIVNCITDTVAVVLYGGKLPWSQIIIAHAKRSGAGIDAGGQRQSTAVPRNDEEKCSRGHERVVGSAVELQAGAGSLVGGSSHGAHRDRGRLYPGNAERKNHDGPRR